MSALDLHSPFRLREPKDWVLYLSPRPPKRLVLFVHGFRGRAVKTWENFPEIGHDTDWWLDSDMLFVGYDSMRDGITGVANRIRRNFDRFYPRPPDEAMTVEGVAPRPDDGTPYSELLVVAHSLGGVIARRVLADAMQAWRESPAESPRPRLLDAELRLFSPASAGFRAAGLLGAVRATGLWAALELYLRSSSAYTDLQPNSDVLVDTRRRTEELAQDPEAGALKARILWAEREDVVIAVRYLTDFVDESAPGRNHINVCKPTQDYTTPWRFVSTGTAT